MSRRPDGLDVGPVARRLPETSPARTGPPGSPCSPEKRDVVRPQTGMETYGKGQASSGRHTSATRKTCQVSGHFCVSQNSWGQVMTGQGRSDCEWLVEPAQVLCEWKKEVYRYKGGREGGRREGMEEGERADV